MPDLYMPDVIVEVAFNAGYNTPATSRTWTDVSDYVELDQQIEVTFGRQNELSAADANRATLTLDNSDGRFTAGRAASPYYPNVKVGRPLRVSAIQAGTSNLVTNTGAEVNVTGWSGFGGSSVARSTAQAHAGAASFLCTWPTAAAEASTVFATVSGLTVGRHYLYEAYVRVPSSQPRMRLKAGSYKSAITTTTNQWERLYLTFMADATTEDIEVKHADASTAGQTGYFDSVSARLTEVRFVGFVDGWPVEWDGSDEYARAAISASSRLSRLGLSAKLRSAIEQEVILPGPIGYWTLGDPQGSTTAAESSGRGIVGPLIQQTPNADNPNVALFGNAVGVGSDGLTAMDFPDDSTRMEAWLPSGTTVKSLRFGFIGQANPTGGFSLMAAVNGSTSFISTLHNGAAAAVPYGVGAGTFVGPSYALEAGSAAPGVLHELVYTSSVADGAKLYLDGTLIDTAAGTDHTNMISVRIGATGALYDFVFCHLAIYDTILTPTQVSDQAQAALTGFAGQRTDQRVVRALSWVGVPSSEVTVETGVETMTYQLTGGMSVIDVLREAESTEGGVLFDGRDGNVTFHNRSHRYTAAVAATLNMASQHVGADYVPRVDRSTLVNDVEIENPTTGAKVRGLDTASRDEYGVATASVTSVAESTFGFRERADWVLASYAEPRMRVPSLTVDVLAHQGLTPSAQTLLGLTVGDLLAVSNAPSQSDVAAPSYFVEGYSEVIGPESYGITFNLSPSSPTADVLILDSATRGLLDTNVLGY